VHSYSHCYIYITFTQIGLKNSGRSGFEADLKTKRALKPEQQEISGLIYLKASYIY